MLFWLSVVATGVIAVLGWTLYRHLGSSRIEAITNKRRATSRIVSRGEFVDGSRHLTVALALTSTDLFYENADLEGSLDLRWVREVEYDTRLATGHAVEGGQVLRMRCFSQVFEFVLADDVVSRWHLMLPPRDRNGSPAEVTALVPIAT
ncbi:MAG TPA: hypothetical protein VHW00_20280 [Thermoanaerobaculia bacterium]|nr:hypothetical protein [Thermoanaerobaculia bacterium]